jgi:hypothetical protein
MEPLAKTRRPKVKAVLLNLDSPKPSDARAEESTEMLTLYGGQGWFEDYQQASALSRAPPPDSQN